MIFELIRCMVDDKSGSGSGSGSGGLDKVVLEKSAKLGFTSQIYGEN
jgi:hypothetical protein